MLIEETDVTAVNLAVELERAVIEHRLDEDKSIYVTEDGWFPFWIRVVKGAGYVTLKSHTYFKKAAGGLQRLEICNELNKSKYMLTCYAVDDRMYFDHALNFRDGLLRENFVRACRQFSKAIETGLQDADPEHLIVLMPGQSEPEDETGDEKRENT
jgi:hypothetical protein